MAPAIVIAGIDGTRESFEAGRQAARLAGPSGRLLLVAVADPALALLNRWGPTRLVDPDEEGIAEVLPVASQRLRERAAASLAAVREQVARDDLTVEERVAQGRPGEALRDLAAEERADIVALGGRPAPRLASTLGTTSSELMHGAPCSVLVARPPFDPARFPRSVVVGVDGSSASLAALDLARALSGGPGGPPQVRVVASREEAREPAILERLAAPLPIEIRRGRPVEVLLEAARAADLLVVGARGLGGVRLLGSVSERVAHRAESSVLVARGRA